MRNRKSIVRGIGHEDRLVLSVFVGLFIVLLSGTAKAANVRLQACGPQATMGPSAPTQVVVVYWTTSAGNDSLQESQFDLAFTQGLLGTPYNGVVAQYYAYSGTSGSPS